MGSKSDTVFPGWSWSLINFPISFVPLILASSMLSAAFSLAIIPVEIEASAILLNGGNENICKDIHNSLNSVFIFSFAGRVQITVAMSLLIVAQVLMQAFQNICSIRSSDFSSFYCTNLSWKSSSATRCFRVLVDCHFNNFVSLTPAKTVGTGQLYCKITIWKALVHFWEIIFECEHITKEVSQIACIVYIVVSEALQYHILCTFQKQVPTPSPDSIDCVKQQLDHFPTP